MTTEPDTHKNVTVNDVNRIVAANYEALGIGIPKYPEPEVHHAKPMPERSRLLYEAEQIITGDRNAQYGEPHQDFARTAEMWSAYFGIPIEAHQVAGAMILLKISRTVWSPDKYDHWLDIAGYAACGYEAHVKTHPIPAEG